MTFTEPKDDLRLLAAVTAAYTIGVLGGNMQPLVIGALIDGLGMEAGSAGLLSSMELTAVALAAFILAPRMAAIPRRTVILAGAALAALGYAGSMRVQSFGALSVYRVIAGTGAGMVLAVGNATVSACRQPDRIFAQMTVVGTLLITAVLALLPWAISGYSYRGGYAGMALVVCAMAPFLFWIPDKVALGTERSGAAAARTRLGVSTAAAAALLFFGQSAMWAFSERIALAAQLNTAQIGLALSGSTLAGLCGAFGASWFGLRRGRLLPLTAGILATGGTLLALVYTRTPLAYTAVLVLNGVAYLFMVPYVMGTAAALDPHGRWAAATVGAATIGAALGPGVAGKLVAAAGYTAVGWIIFAAALLSAAAVAPVGRALDRTSAEEAVLASPAGSF